MNEDPGSTNGPTHKSWWDRLGHLFSGELRSRDELLEELRAAQTNGLLTSETLAMVEGALKVTELDVDDVMIPRVQMVMIPAGAPLKDIIATVVESGHSRFPVHGEDKDDILGILLAKDLLKHFGDGEDFDIRTLLRPAVLIPESMRLNVLLAEFRLSHNHMAIVVDEYGGVAGLITIEDVLEEIVGEIDDEHDDEEPPVHDPVAARRRLPGQRADARSPTSTTRSAPASATRNSTPSAAWSPPSSATCRKRARKPSSTACCSTSPSPTTAACTSSACSRQPADPD